MEVLKTFDPFSLNLYNVSTSIIYNDERMKKRIIDFLDKEDYIVINSVIFDSNITVKDFFKECSFPLKLIPEFNLKRIISRKLNEISHEDFIFIKLLAFINLSRLFVVFDDVLTFLSTQNKKTVINFARSKNLIIYNFTSDEEEVLYFPYTICLASNKVAIEGPTKKVITEEKILKKLGFDLPFVVDLSLQLNYYNVTDHVYFDIDKLVKDLWKKQD